MRAVSIISEKSIDMIAQCLYYDKSTEQNSVQLKSMSISVDCIVSSVVRIVLSRHAMAMKNGQSLNKRYPGIAHNTAFVSVDLPCVTSQHLSAPAPYVTHCHTSLDRGPPSSVTLFLDVPQEAPCERTLFWSRYGVVDRPYISVITAVIHLLCFSSLQSEHNVLSRS